ncbi:CcoQ/FixQ family Cbb3-type cytochrome c oxidase assembly chaperone [Accumulibacter sp.]|mgnify:CR=1 FL=1|uniref:CcoQ/FixQ family Cbb3-type cytochrome c oxidase assembly chaperone n=1 Tax=Candidatus Accumulibacter proximus TaxID=2954385 RepID=A0A935UJI0_9PROT|nr:CcoQ/FixQ family Cbb3-type cytochrome c oxidase assembly chaperone [Accumulibacter sp.]MBK7677720.1 CcoQ/FixQ family Cbb3-type cytochrome c oxidase assembly chaperone [Candidatus Accumulibacter proximus]MBL8373213.1 CcoQ/FixQ family Cbb3-type cytochrome c oxidase assembly chaperone [Accumulibacter sp.]
MDLTIYHFVLIAAFVAIVVWVFGHKRKARFEQDARIPFEEGKD